MLQDNKKYIGKMFSNKDLKILIVPLIIEQFLAITVGMSDTVMVSFAGEAAVSGVSLVDMVNNVIISLLAALATGGAVVISQFIGAKKHEDACMAAAQLELMAFSVAFFISIFAIIFAHPLISFLFGNIDNEVFAACKKYLIITAISFPMLAIYNSGAAIYRSIGDSKTSMKVSILMNIINVIGNYIGVFKLHLGVAGVAIPSVVSRGVAAVVITLLASNNKNALVYLKIKEVFSLQMNFMRRILYIGIPSGIENSLFQVGRVAVVSIISNFGRTQIAANAIANNIDGLGVNMGNALGITMITVIGRCVGAGNYKEARYYVKKLMLIGYLAILIPAVVIFIFQNIFISIYNVSDATKELTAILVWIHMGVAIFIWPLSFILPNALRAGSDVKFTMSVSLFSMAVFRFGTSLFIAKVFKIGAIGVWCAMIIDWVFRSSNFVYRFVSGKWWHKDLKKE